MEISKIFKGNITAKRIFKFIADLYRYDKIRELLSFIVWEFQYIFLYRKHQLLPFIDTTPLSVLSQIDKQAKIKSDSFEISQSIVNWSLVFIDSSQNYWGTKYDDESTLYRCTAEGETIASFKFKGTVLGVYISKTDSIFCCANGILYKSSEDKKSFKEVLKFSTSDSYFLIDAFTESPTGELFVAEYANIFENKKWKFVGYIYYSLNNGDSWKKTDFLKKAGINKHVHLLKWSNIINGLILTDGDNQKNIWMNLSKTQFEKPALSPKSGWKKLNRYHIQKGGYTGFAELDDKIIFGSDYNGGTNFLISTKDMIKFEEKVIPNPYRRAIFKRIAIRINEKNEYEIWAVIQFKHSRKIKSLIMLSMDSGKTWKRIIEYDGTRFRVLMISNSRQIAKELYLLIIEKNKNIATTMYIHS